MKILTDTNMLMLPGQLKVDVFEQLKELAQDQYPLELVVLSQSIAELKNMNRGHSPTAIASRIALKVLELNRPSIYDGKLNKADESIILWAEENDNITNRVYVCTNDRLLRQQLKKKNIGTILLKGRKLSWS